MGVEVHIIRALCKPPPLLTIPLLYPQLNGAIEQSSLSALLLYLFLIGTVCEEQNLDALIAANFFFFIADASVGQQQLFSEWNLLYNL